MPLAFYLDRTLYWCERWGWFRNSTWDTTNSFTMSGGLVGGMIGYNYQFGRAVIGAEGDIDWNGIKGTTTTGTCPAGCTTSDSWLSMVRARLGYAADRFMPYVTGGGAFGTSMPPRQASPADLNNVGWTLGPASTSRLPAIGRRKRNTSTSISANSIARRCGAPTDNVSFTTSVVRAGVNYRF